MLTRLLKITARIALLAGIILGGALSAALAAEIRYAGTSLRVRSGPGADFPVQGEIRRGDVFVMDECRGSYCFAKAVRDGLTGWIPRGGHRTSPTTNNFIPVSNQSNPQVVLSTARLNLRAGPGDTYMKLREIPKGERLRKENCRQLYCFVLRANGMQGWVLETALVIAPVMSNSGTLELPSQDSVQTEVDSPPLPDKHEVCVYEHINYGGRSLCFEKATEIENLASASTGWNDQISSIRINGPFTISYCEHAQFRGECRSITKSVSSLGIFNDKISSFVIYKQD